MFIWKVGNYSETRYCADATTASEKLIALLAKGDRGFINEASLAERLGKLRVGYGITIMHVYVEKFTLFGGG